MITILFVILGLLICVVALLGYLAYLGMCINNVLLNMGYDVSDLAPRIRAVLPGLELAEAKECLSRFFEKLSRDIEEIKGHSNNICDFKNTGERPSPPYRQGGDG